MKVDFADMAFRVGGMGQGKGGRWERLSVTMEPATKTLKSHFPNVNHSYPVPLRRPKGTTFLRKKRYKPIMPQLQ